jgi:hypothetical protein
VDDAAAVSVQLFNLAVWVNEPPHAAAAAAATAAAAAPLLLLCQRLRLLRLLLYLLRPAVRHPPLRCRVVCAAAVRRRRAAAAAVARAGTGAANVGVCAARASALPAAAALAGPPLLPRRQAQPRGWPCRTGPLCQSQDGRAVWHVHCPVPGQQLRLPRRPHRWAHCRRRPAAA